MDYRTMSVELTDRIRNQWQNTFPGTDLLRIAEDSTRVEDESILPRKLEFGALAFAHPDYPQRYFIVKVDGNSLVFIGMMQGGQVKPKSVDSLTDEERSLIAEFSGDGKVSLRTATFGLMRRVLELEEQGVLRRMANERLSTKLRSVV